MTSAYFLFIGHRSCQPVAKPYPMNKFKQHPQEHMLGLQTEWHHLHVATIMAEWLGVALVVAAIAKFVWPVLVH